MKNSKNNFLSKIVFVRHGQSLANLENRFTGWLDIDLTTKGYNEAYKLGLKLKKAKIEIDICYTSLLKRAIRTTWGILDGLNSLYIKIKKSMYLNERHYGELSGLNIEEGIKKFGKKNILSWLNDYNTAPPPIIKKKFLKIYKKSQYKNIPKKNIPSTESLNQTLQRALILWNKYIIKNLKLNKNILIVAHSNILKLLIKYIDKNMTNKNELIPNTTPIIYEFDKNIKKIKSYILI